MTAIPIVVLVSGRGTNLRRIVEVEDQYAYRVVGVVADRAAEGLTWATERGIPTRMVEWSAFPDRETFTAALCDAIEELGADLVVLAGFMRILAPLAIERFPGRILNIHPSLLPDFPGAHAVEEALAAGVTETGVTVHVVVEDVDAGPILAQRPVPVEPGDDAATLHSRIQKQEHALYPMVIDDVSRSIQRGGTDMERRVRIERALLSVSDKAGLAKLGTALHEAGVELIASGGTAAALEAAGVPVTAVSEVTGAPEMLGGRVKTLHPSIHGAILADTGDESHEADLVARDIAKIDLVVCNLYPFEQALAAGNSGSELVEKIDIGGPAMVRAAAKNHKRVAVVTDPADYSLVIAALEAGGTTVEERRNLAAAAFAHTGRYDAIIHRWLAGAETLPSTRLLALDRAQPLRYGENPHQDAALYRRAGSDGWPFAARQLQGKPLSFNNYADTDSAWDLVHRIDSPGCVVVKHLNPCGVAERPTSLEAFTAARDCDPLSAFGGVVALNATLDEATAKEMASMFLEVIICPEITDEAADALSAKKNLRVLVSPPRGRDPVDVRQIDGGLLIQETDPRRTDVGRWQVVSDVHPTPEQLEQLRLAWTVGAHCKSNSIVIVQGGAAVGIGVGDQSRVGAAKRAVDQAGADLVGAVAASEALIPFRDGLDALAAAGIVAVVETGGSRNDQEVIDAANEHGLALLFTGMRHFRH